MQAEARRLMIEPIALSPGDAVERWFIVNVRTPALPLSPGNEPGAPAVRLASDENNSPDWDDKLTFEVPECASSVTDVTVEPAHVPTVYLLGDSTVTDQWPGPGASWGQMLPRFFSPMLATRIACGEAKSRLPRSRGDASHEARPRRGRVKLSSPSLLGCPGSPTGWVRSHALQPQALRCQTDAPR